MNKRCTPIAFVFVVEAAGYLSHSRWLMSTRSVSEAAADVGANEAINDYIKGNARLKSQAHCLLPMQSCFCVCLRVCGVWLWR